MTVESDQRKYSRHINRVLCQYLVIQCWVRGYDGVLIDDNWLKDFYGVRALREERCNWLQTDSTPWFVFERKRWRKRVGGPFEYEYRYYTRILLKRRKGNLSENYWDGPEVDPNVDKMQLYLAQRALGTKVPNPRHGR